MEIVDGPALSEDREERETLVHFRQHFKALKPDLDLVQWSPSMYTLIYIQIYVYIHTKGLKDRWTNRWMDR